MLLSGLAKDFNIRLPTLYGFGSATAHGQVPNQSGTGNEPRPMPRTPKSGSGPTLEATLEAIVQLDRASDIANTYVRTYRSTYVRARVRTGARKVASSYVRM